MRLTRAPSPRKPSLWSEVDLSSGISGPAERALSVCMFVRVLMYVPACVFVPPPPPPLPRPFRRPPVLSAQCVSYHCPTIAPSPQGRTASRTSRVCKRRVHVPLTPCPTTLSRVSVPLSRVPLILSRVSVPLYRVPLSLYRVSVPLSRVPL